MYLHVCQVRVSVDGCTSDGVYILCILHARYKTVGDSGLCPCVCVTSVER